MKRFCLTVAVAGALALGTSKAVAFPINTAAFKAVPSNIANTQWHGTQWINPEVCQTELVAPLPVVSTALRGVAGHPAVLPLPRHVHLSHGPGLGSVVVMLSPAGRTRDHE